MLPSRTAGASPQGGPGSWGWEGYLPAPAVRAVRRRGRADHRPTEADKPGRSRLGECAAGSPGRGRTRRYRFFGAGVGKGRQADGDARQSGSDPRMRSVEQAAVAGGCGIDALGRRDRDRRCGDQQVRDGVTSFATPPHGLPPKPDGAGQGGFGRMFERVEARRRGGRQQCRPLFARSAAARQPATPG